MTRIGPKAVVTRDELVIPEVRFAESYNGKRQPNRLCFYGTKEDGYHVNLFWGGFGVRVKKADDGLWYASYSGQPDIHNGWVRNPDCSISISGMMPRVHLEKGWRTRRDAALAAIIVNGRERDLCDTFRGAVEKNRVFVGERACLSEGGWQYVKVGGSATARTP